MNRSRLHVDYATPERTVPSRSSPWVVALLTFPVCWGGALVLYWRLQYEGFLWSEAIGLIAVWGTSSGLAFYLIVAILLLVSDRWGASGTG